MIGEANEEGIVIKVRFREVSNIGTWIHVDPRSGYKTPIQMFKNESIFLFF